VEDRFFAILRYIYLMDTSGFYITLQNEYLAVGLIRIKYIYLDMITLFGWLNGDKVVWNIVIFIIRI
jgi:hypothetical protein